MRKRRRDGGGLPGSHRNRWNTIAGEADSDERLLPPGGVSGERRKGARGMRWRGFYRHRALGEGLGYQGGARSTATGESGSARALARGGGRLWRVGPICQRLEEVASITIRLGGVLGRGLYQGLGRMAPPRPFSLFLFLFDFSFSCFLFLFSIFHKSTQIISNQLLKSSKKSIPGFKPVNKLVSRNKHDFFNKTLWT
jgi:hypothetical protein